MRTRPLDILLVEDHEPDAFTVTRFTEQLNHEAWSRAGRQAMVLHRAHRLAEALDLLKTQDIDVVLLDLNLPDSFALHTLKAVTTQAPEMAVVILTEADDDQLAAKAVGEGAQDFLVKSGLTAGRLGHALRFAWERQRSVNALREACFVDGLTGLYSRRGFLILAGAYLALEVVPGYDAAVMVVEVEDLRDLVQKHGQAEADLALIELGERLKDAVGDDGLLGRLDLGLFAAIAFRQTGAMDRLKTALEEFRKVKGLALVTGSARGEGRIEELILQARIHLTARAHAHA